MVPLHVSILPCRESPQVSIGLADRLSTCAAPLSFSPSCWPSARSSASRASRISPLPIQRSQIQLMISVSPRSTRAVSLKAFGHFGSQDPIQHHQISQDGLKLASQEQSANLRYMREGFENLLCVRFLEIHVANFSNPCFYQRVLGGFPRLRLASDDQLPANESCFPERLQSTPEHGGEPRLHIFQTHQMTSSASSKARIADQLGNVVAQVKRVSEFSLARLRQLLRAKP